MLHFPIHVLLRDLPDGDYNAATGPSLSMTVTCSSSHCSEESPGQSVATKGEGEKEVRDRRADPRGMQQKIALLIRLLRGE